MRKTLLLFLTIIITHSLDAQEYSPKLLQKANSGDLKAQFDMGEVYMCGWGCEENEQVAISWYERAASNGYLPALHSLIEYYSKNSDVDNSRKWLMRAAELGDVQSMRDLGVSYGRTSPEALYWFEKAAIHTNDGASLGMIGWYYFQNEKVKDYKKAFKCFSKGSELNDLESIDGLAHCYAYGRGIYCNINKSLDLIDKNIKSEPRNPKWYDSKGEFYLLGGDWENAMLMRNKVLSLDKSYDENNSTLFMCLRSGEGIKPDGNTFDPSRPPLLFVDNNSICFEDASGNNAIDANETNLISFDVKNSGLSDGRECFATVSISGDSEGIDILDFDIPLLKVGSATKVSIPIQSNSNTEDGSVAITVAIEEPNGFGTDPFTININTKAFEPPMLKVTDYALTGTTGTLQKKVPFNLQLLLQNVKYGEAYDVTISISVPENIFILDGDVTHNFMQISSGKVHSLEYTMVANNNYAGTSIPIQVSVTEKYGKYAESRTINLDFDQVFASNKISLEEINQGPKKDIEIASLSSEVDKNIPITGLKNNNTFAIIIANENYQNDAKVDYALNDGRIFKEYCLKTLGIPESNIKLSPDATLNNLRNNISWIKDVASVYKGEAEIIFYYAGHGVPDDSSKEAFLLPVDGDGRLASQTGYSLKQLYSDLASCNTKSTLVFMDACFSGAQRNGQMLASARGVVIKAKDDAPQGNMVVFSAASAEQTAHQFADKQHGMFTYFLLKKLQETNGNVTLGELGNYIIDNVSKESIVRNSKLQTPTVTPSSVIGDWTNMKL